MESCDRHSSNREQTFLSRLSDFAVAPGEHLKNLWNCTGSQEKVSNSSEAVARAPMPHLELVGFDHQPSSRESVAAGIHELAESFAATPAVAKDFQDYLSRTAKLSLFREQQSELVHALQFLSNDSSAVPDKNLRDKLVAAVVHQIAHPDAIRQGYKGTCALATSELLLATNRPDAYATAIADWVHQGNLQPALVDAKKARITGTMLHGNARIRKGSRRC
jgi:hypothetical protein